MKHGKLMCRITGSKQALGCRISPTLPVSPRGGAEAQGYLEAVEEVGVN